MNQSGRTRPVSGINYRAAEFPSWQESSQLEHPPVRRHRVRHLIRVKCHERRPRHRNAFPLKPALLQRAHKPQPNALSTPLAAATRLQTTRSTLATMSRVRVWVAVLEWIRLRRAREHFHTWRCRYREVHHRVQPVVPRVRVLYLPTSPFWDPLSRPIQITPVDEYGRLPDQIAGIATIHLRMSICGLIFDARQINRDNHGS